MDVLERSGIEHFFGTPGGAIAPLYDALFDRPHLQLTHVRHETSAAFIATGHHFLRPEALTCVLTTSGPGVTNLLTGLASAKAEHVPMVVLVGEVPRSKFGHGALQEGSDTAMDILGMTRSIVCHAQRLGVASHAPIQLAAAIERARRERGPVLLSLPLDVSVENIPAGQWWLDPPATPAAIPEAALQLAATLRKARRPLVVVGAGARSCAPAVRTLTQRLCIPVVSTPSGKGIVPESAPHCLGVFGYGGHPCAQAWLESAPPDVVLVLGSSLSEVATNGWSPLLQATDVMIHLDDDAEPIGLNYRVDIAIAGSWRPTLRALVERLADAPRGSGTNIEIARLDNEREHDDDTPLHPARVLHTLQQSLPSDAVFAADVGENLLFSIHHIRAERPDQFLCSLETGSMGSGLGAGLGAKMAAPDRTVAVICGDYAFQMYGMELHTAVQLRLDLIYVVMNDSRMRMVEAGLTRTFGRSGDMAGPQICFATAARAHGAAGVIVRESEDLRTALRTRPRDRPLLLDCRIDPKASFPTNARLSELGTFAKR